MGLRWGECAGLKVGRLDRVCWQRTRGPGGVMVEDPLKSKKGIRTETAPEELMDMLAEHLAWRGLTGADPDAYVFTSPEGDPLDYSNWYHNAGVPARWKVGLYDLWLHHLRDANGTAMEEGGVGPKTAQKRLGHADMRTTLDLHQVAPTRPTARRRSAGRPTRACLVGRAASGVMEYGAVGVQATRHHHRTGWCGRTWFALDWRAWLGRFRLRSFISRTSSMSPRWPSTVCFPTTPPWPPGCSPSRLATAASKGGGDKGWLMSLQGVLWRTTRRSTSLLAAR